MSGPPRVTQELPDDWVPDDHPDRAYYCEGCMVDFPRSDGLVYPGVEGIWCPHCSDLCEPYYEPDWDGPAAEGSHG